HGPPAAPGAGTDGVLAWDSPYLRGEYGRTGHSGRGPRFLSRLAFWGGSSRSQVPPAPGLARASREGIWSCQSRAQTVRTPGAQGRPRCSRRSKVSTGKEVKV